MRSPARTAPAAGSQRAKPVVGPTTGNVAPYVAPMVPDPNICISGRWKVLQRTDGVWIVYDEFAPFANRTVDGGETRDAARSAAEHLAKGWAP